SLKTSIKTITYLSDIGCLEIQGASLPGHYSGIVNHVIASGIFCSASGGFSFKAAFISGIECEFCRTGIIP
ncbi:hypothetical protein U4X50_16125, partial [Escherichia coli]|nr:hypothetical protein [Escherichia coli]